MKYWKGTGDWRDDLAQTLISICFPRWQILTINCVSETLLSRYPSSINNTAFLSPWWGSWKEPSLTSQERRIATRLTDIRSENYHLLPGKQSSDWTLQPQIDLFWFGKNLASVWVHWLWGGCEEWWGNTRRTPICTESNLASLCARVLSVRGGFSKYHLTIQRGGYNLSAATRSILSQRPTLSTTGNRDCLEIRPLLNWIMIMAFFVISP